MTPRELIDETRARGITLRVDGNKIKARHLRKEEREFLKANARAVAAVLELDAIDSADDALARQLWAAREAEYEAERQIDNRRRMGNWDEQKVQAMAEAGQLTAEDIKLWREARNRVRVRPRKQEKEEVVRSWR